MTHISRKQLAVLAVMTVPFGLYGWAMVVATGTGHDGAIGPHYNALGADWVIFYTAARAFFAGQIAHVYDQAWLTPHINSATHESRLELGYKCLDDIAAALGPTS